MTAPRDHLLYIRDILQAIDSIDRYTQGYTFDQFKHDAKTQDAVVRNLEIIGEAVKRLPNELRAAHPDIEWQPAAAMRDFLIHQYPDIEIEIVWDTIKGDLPLLKEGARRCLE